MKVADKFLKSPLILFNFAREFTARNIGEATWSEKHEIQM